MHHESYLLPIGPYHPLLKEPEYFKVFVEGEEIVGLDFSLGFNYRGVEELVTKREWEKAVFLVERICGVCGVHHSLDFCQGVEKLAGLKVPERAKYIRVIMGELNRLQSHLILLALVGYSMGFNTLFQWCMGAREKVLDQTERIAGNRIHYSMVCIGGVRKDITPKIIKELEKSLKEIRKDVKEIHEIFRTNRTIEKRLGDIGRISREKAKELGVVGPVARGSNVNNDVRKLAPYAAYPDLDFKAVLEKGEDCLARNLVRTRECLESIKLIREALDLPSGEIKAVEKIKTVPEGEVTMLVEAPRGENMHYLVSNEGRTPKKLRIRVPTYANLISLNEMVKGGKLADIPVTIQSLDPCFGCTDRMQVIDTKAQKKKEIRFDKFLKGERKRVSIG